MIWKALLHSSGCSLSARSLRRMFWSTPVDATIHGAGLETTPSPA